MASGGTSLRQGHRRPPAIIKQEQDDDSDAEEGNLALRRSDGVESQIIHSGHFMVSSPHIEHPPKKGYDFDTVNMQTCQTYHFGKASTCHLSIDASLTKLFECMTLAYSGKLVSPKWKNFKGLKLLWRDKIRLNNAIWRAWYMQYVEKRANPVCHFMTPLDGNIESDMNRSSEVNGTEGKCWKRRIEIVIREYHKWRTYFKKRLQKHKDEDLSSLLKGPAEQLLLFGELSPDMLRVSSHCQDEEALAAWRVSRKHSGDTAAPMEMDSLFDMDVLMSEFSDTLFSTLASHQPISWPNPREIAHAGNADMIQPGLIPLQPNLDFMDSFDPLQDLFHSLRQSTFPSVSPLPSNSSQSQVQLLSAMQLTSNPLPQSVAMSLPSTLTGDRTSDLTGGGSSGDAAYVPNFVPLYPGQMTAGGAALVAPDPLAQCLTGPDVVGSDSVAAAAEAPSVITHTAVSTVTASQATTTFSHGSVSQQQQQQQTFAMPRPLRPSSASAKNPNSSVQRIAPAPQLFLTAPFAAPTNAVIVTPATLKADVVPTTGVVLAPNLAGPSGFHVVSHSQKSPKPIVPKEKSYPSSRKHQKASAGDGPSQPGSGQGSPCGLDQVPSPQSLVGGVTTLVKNEQNQGRRTTHISAEQKRRTHIKFGFKTLGGLVPALKSQSNTSNAVTLQKTVEHIGKLQTERQQVQEEVKRLREEIEELNTSISSCQELLPATGVPIRPQRFDHNQEFSEYVRSRTLQNWKFWIFSIIIKPLFDSFNQMVSTSSREELSQTTLQWLSRCCSLRELRPMVLSTLRQLSTATSILSDPSLLPEEAIRAVTEASE